MAIIPAAGDLVDRGDQAVPLPLYSQVIGYDEAAFYGIVREDPPAVHSNKPLWRKDERDLVAHHLAEAQAEIEQVCGFPLNARWFAAESHDYGNYLMTDQTKLIEAGIEATDAFVAGAGVAVSYVADPSVVGPIVTTVTDEDEIKVYHPGTTIEINPSSVTIALGNVTIEIPRARLLTEAGEAVTNGVDYTDTGAPAGLFEQTVDVVRVYNDDSTQGTLVWSHGTTGCPDCSGATATACLTILNAEIGEMDILRADYSSESWGTANITCYCHLPDIIRVNYRAGLETLTAQARDAIIRLAHSKMPASPCNCDPANYVWARDQVTPRALTADRINCPFGLNEGAWIAYQFARAMKVVRGSTL
jgi:hypothetical protein